MITKILTLPMILFLAANSLQAQVGNASYHLKDLGSVHIPGGVEIVAPDAHTGKLYACGSDGYMVFDFDELNRFSILHTQSFSNTQEWQPTSIAVDPAQRGFAVCAWVPDPVDRMPGVIQVINTETDLPVWQFNAGFHPDCISFTPDGRYLVAANEGEPGETNRPGAITLIDLSSIRSAEDFIGFNETQSFGFTESHFGNGVDLGVLRISPEFVDRPEIDIEPEYLAPTNDGVWVGLQENNGLVYFDFSVRQWTKVYSLGSRSHAFDASDQDGIQINVQQGFQMICQPDTIALTTIDDKEYIILANEGEKADEDIIRLEDAIATDMIDPSTVDRLKRYYPGVRFEAIGRVWISTIDGDLDRDGDIDVPSVLGARSVSIIDAADGSLVWDSGSQFERMTSQYWPDRYNSNDGRSDHAGPEPEGIAVGRFEDRTLLCVGLERTDAVVMYDISNPVAPFLLDAQTINSLCSRPEGMSLFHLFDTRMFLAVASEEGGCLTIYEIVSDQD